MAIAKQKGRADAAASLHQSFAWGVYFAWDSLTRGWQRAGDQERLEALTELDWQH
ncbi:MULTISPECIES: hypothetical protein [unclassified Undibacterium]|nr:MULTISPECIES: hypothetical protein [unclassified Undibacterium]MEB0216331.1 hypothetical protein [Undibacterium sp. 5I2]WPX42515.1 hypothetical protein RHM61_14100 [Undibacterium sp. CCC3.4]